MMKTCRRGLHTYSDDLRQCPECRKAYYKEHLEERKVYYKEHKERYKAYREEHREEAKIYAKTRTWNTRNIVLNHYGNQCACCGEAQKEFLGIDHMNGGGNVHRKQIGHQLYHWLIKNRFPPGFQILCHNCNLAKGFYGRCPHQRNTT